MSPPPPLTLVGRLLCAAQQTYEIKVSGAAPPSPAQPAPPPSTLVGWEGVPQCEVAGEDEINAVMVGETAGEVIVAYRGTLPFDSPDKVQMILDWIDDIMDEQVSAPPVPGLVHQGFSGAVNELWDWTLAQVQAKPKGKPLYVTGHSKGGAMANIAATKFAAAGMKPYVCTFEAARAGDPDFATGFAKMVTNATRFEFQDDIVPFLPPGDTFMSIFKSLPEFAAEFGKLQAQVAGDFPNYVPVGDLHFINWQNQIVPDSLILDVQRMASILTLIVELKATQIIDDHSIGPGSGVANVLCPGEWPVLLTA
ncbi:MAG TPA: lipase family protein [Caulobacteraceae bacterium]|nr:lipase family protein [Caulobacteraceae bacterium]